MLDDLAPTPAERRVIDGAATGSSTDFRAPDDVVARGKKWGPKRTVRAEVLAELLTRQPDADQQPRLLSVAGARITGQLVLESLTLVRPLVLNDCYIEQPVILNEARATRLDFTGCRLSGLQAMQLETRGDLTLDRVTETAELVLAGARIGGVLGLRAAALAGGDPVLDGYRLEVHVGMDCEGLSAEGRVHLIGAHIRGQLNLSGARLRGSDDAALDGDGLQVDKDMFGRTDSDGQRFEADGEVRLVGAHIGGELDFRGAYLCNANGAALNAAGLEVDQGMFCRNGDDGQRFEADGEVRLVGAHIGDDLDFRGAYLGNANGAALNAAGLQVDQGMFCRNSNDGQRFEADGELRLSGAHIGGNLVMSGARLTKVDGVALNADRLHVDQSMICRSDGGQRFEAEGELRLLYAHVKGLLNLTGGRLSPTKGAAFNADGLQIDQHLICRPDEGGQRFEADGELRLNGAHIRGQFDLRGARLSNAEGTVLNADGLRVDQDLVCRSGDNGQRFDADGELRLIGAHIGGQFDLSGAHLTHANGTTLSAEGLQVDQDMFCSVDAGNPFETDGEVSLLDAQIGGQLDLSGARMANSRGLAFDFEQGRAKRLTLPRLPDRDASVDLAHAEVSRFHDDPAPASPGETGYLARVEGFTYDSLGPNGSGCDARLAWLKRATDGYVPQAYDQLADAFRRAGLDDDAKKVMIAKQVRRRESMGRLGKVVSVTLGAPVGYGYRTWRAAAVLVAIVILGGIVFSLAHPAHMTETRPTDQMPEFSALLYSLDAVLPVINFGQEIAWSPQGFAQIWYGFSVLVGWLLGLGLVAFLTARFFRE